MTQPDPGIAASFNAPAAGYDALMGRYLPTLAPAFADAADIGPDQTVLDVGAGPGGLTTELVARTGAGNVTAIDPSEPFVQACRDRHPGWTSASAWPNTCRSPTRRSTPPCPAWSSGS